MSKSMSCVANSPDLVASPGPAPDGLPGVPPLVVPLLLRHLPLLHVGHLLGHRPHLLGERCRGPEK